MGDTGLLLFAAVAVLFAGTVKGFVGLGLPMIGMAILTLQIDPRSAIALLLVPTFATNLWQTIRGGGLDHLIHTYGRFAAILGVAVFITVWLSQDTSDRVLLIALGLFVLLFTLLSWRNMVPAIPASLATPFEVAGAIFGGIVGGLTSAWAPPLATYLTARRVPPDEFVQASGFLITIGSLPLIAGYLSVGHASPGTLAQSALLLLPTLAGYTLGEWLRKRSDPGIFRAALLLLLAAIGASLLYRGWALG